MSLVTEQGNTRVEAARNLGVNGNFLRRWIKEHETDNGQAFRGNGKLTPDRQELKNLRAQANRLQMEKEILIEATVFFSTETK